MPGSRATYKLQICETTNYLKFAGSSVFICLFCFQMFTQKRGIEVHYIQHSAYDCKFLGYHPKLLMTAKVNTMEMNTVDQMGYEIRSRSNVIEQLDAADQI